jgi:hypothetical protein
LREYLEITTHVGTPVLYDKIGAVIPEDPLGPLSHANCPCVTTITIGSTEMPREQLIALLEWARHTSAQQSISVNELLTRIRDRIDASVMAGAEVRHGRREA